MPPKMQENVQESITALHKHLAGKFMTPTRIDHDLHSKTVSVTFTGSDAPNRPETLGNLDAQTEKANKFAKLLGRKHINFERTNTNQEPVEIGRHTITVNSARFTFAATELEKLLPKTRQR